MSRVSGDVFLSGEFRYRDSGYVGAVTTAALLSLVFAATFIWCVGGDLHGPVWLIPSVALLFPSVLIAAAVQVWRRARPDERVLLVVDLEGVTYGSQRWEWAEVGMIGGVWNGGAVALTVARRGKIAVINVLKTTTPILAEAEFKVLIDRLEEAVGLRCPGVRFDRLVRSD